LFRGQVLTLTPNPIPNPMDMRSNPPLYDTGMGTASGNRGRVHRYVLV